MTKNNAQIRGAHYTHIIHTNKQISIPAQLRYIQCKQFVMLARGLVDQPGNYLSNFFTHAGNQ